MHASGDRCHGSAHITNAIWRAAGESFAETDKRYLAAEAGANRDDGCTAVTAVLTDSSLVVAHVGDSRAVLSRGGKGAALPPSHALLGSLTAGSGQNP